MVDAISALVYAWVRTTVSPKLDSRFKLDVDIGSPVIDLSLPKAPFIKKFLWVFQWCSGVGGLLVCKRLRVQF